MKRGEQQRQEDNNGTTTTTSTPNHACEQLLMGWKRGATEWQEDEGTGG